MGEQLEEIEPTVHVVLSSDAGFVVPLAATLRSLTRWYRADQPILVHVLYDGIDSETKRRVEASVGDPCRIDWIPAQTLPIDDLPVGRHFSRAVYAKLRLGSVLPSQAHRIVFLDADLLVRRAITPLVGLDIGRATVAGVTCTVGPTAAHPCGVKAWRRCGLDGRQRVVNAGVLVIDLDRWRAADLDTRLTERARAVGADLRFCEQDALNIELGREIADLPFTWNVIEFESAKRTAYSVFPSAEVDDALRDPAIVHFATGRKPWTQDRRSATSPWVREWWDVASELDLDDLLPAKRSPTTWPSRASVRGKLAWSVLTRGPDSIGH